jgi:nitronate monooxygenase
MDRDDLVGELTTLLEAERAGARVGASLVAEAPDAEYEALAVSIHADEVKWAKALFEALVQLGAEPSDKVGDFYEKAMAVPDFENRLAFTNRGQAWVVRRLNDLVPQIEDPGLADMLQAMLDAHIENIGTANDALDARGHPVPPQARL